MVPREQGAGNAPTIAQRIAQRRPGMPRAMAQIADVIAEHPTAPVELTITELAERAGTSPATVTRFCRAIGFDGYTQFRVGVAMQSGRGDADATWSADIGREFGPDDPAETVLRTLVSLHTLSLETTAAGLDLDAVTRVADMIARGRTVDIYGQGSSGIIAEELCGRLYRIGVRAHAWSDVHSGLTSAALQDEHSVAVGISNTGRTEETIQMLSQAGAAGAFTVALTHDPDSWLASVADVTLTSAAPTPYLRPDNLSVKHSQLLVIDLLYLLVAQRTFAEAGLRLAASAMAVSSHRRGGSPRSTRYRTKEAAG
ncbi:MurR/RpiR family transcriptional regulator [Microbacterium pseudoresistens]